MWPRECWVPLSSHYRLRVPHGQDPLLYSLTGVLSRLIPYSSLAWTLQRKSKWCHCLKKVFLLLRQDLCISGWSGASNCPASLKLPTPPLLACILLRETLPQVIQTWASGQHGEFSPASWTLEWQVCPFKWKVFEPIHQTAKNFENLAFTRFYFSGLGIESRPGRYMVVSPKL